MAAAPPFVAVSRFAVPDADGAGFLDRARTALAALAGCAGYRDGWVARATDDPTAWVVLSTWDQVGDYRRALSSYDVRVAGVPLLAEAVDEPSAYEALYALGSDGEAHAAPDRARDAAAVRLGEAAAPRAPRGWD